MEVVAAPVFATEKIFQKKSQQALPYQKKVHIFIMNNFYSAIFQREEVAAIAEINANFQ